MPGGDSSRMVEPTNCARDRWWSSHAASLASRYRMSTTFPSASRTGSSRTCGSNTVSSVARSWSSFAVATSRAWTRSSTSFHVAIAPMNTPCSSVSGTGRPEIHSQLPSALIARATTGTSGAVGRWRWVNAACTSGCAPQSSGWTRSEIGRPTRSAGRWPRMRSTDGDTQRMRRSVSSRNTTSEACSASRR